MKGMQYAWEWSYSATKEGLFFLHPGWREDKTTIWCYDIPLEVQTEKNFDPTWDEIIEVKGILGLALWVFDWGDLL